MNQNTDGKLGMTYFAAALVVLVFAIASVGAIMWMESQKVPILGNDTAWVESYLERMNQPKLTEKQKDIIHNSVEIVSKEAVDAGVTVTLQAAYGNGYNIYYKLDVMLSPDKYDVKNDVSLSVQEISLNINDNSMGLGSTGASIRTIQDDNPNDNHFWLLIGTMLGYYKGCDYQFNTGIVRTLHLENLRIGQEDGKDELVQGQWNFDILVQDKGEVVELLQEPVLVGEADFLREKYFEGEITSFMLTEFAAYCEYQATPNSQESFIAIRPVVILKDGSTILLGGDGGSGTSFSFSSPRPIPLDEVAFVKLTDQVVIPFSRAFL